MILTFPNFQIFHKNFASTVLINHLFMALAKFVTFTKKTPIFKFFILSLTEDTRSKDRLM